MVDLYRHPFPVKMRAHSKPWNEGVDILIYQEPQLPGERRGYVTSFTLEKIEEGECVVPQPTITMYPQDAQTLMDELWQCGLRPTEGHGSVGQLGATEKHLKFAEQLVRHTLKMKE